MIAEFGLFALCLAFSLACVQTVLPAYGLMKRKPVLIQTARPLAYGQFFFVTMALVALVVSLLNDDFSLAYVAQHSNSSLPWFYKLGALWGAHEGSMLLWDWELCAWMAAVALLSSHLSRRFAARVLCLLSFLNIGLLAFILCTSSPFMRLLPQFPIDGNDLNPVLQDMGLILHPPLLYMGYVGLSVPWAFAMAALWEGQLRVGYLAALRPWVLSAWGALSLGITLGSWWAYYELGWGGWWFWDAVENASFMPWLVTTALLHGLQVAQQKKGLYLWVLFLCLSAFFLSLLGTFLIRSGVLSSVHAFALDPSRGLYLLVYLAVVMGLALALFIARAPKFQKQIQLKAYSREAWLMAGTALICISAASILLGTLFPLIYEAFTHDKVSVGFPYFNAVFVPIMVPLLLILPIGVASRWGQRRPWLDYVQQFKGIAFISVLASLSVPWWQGHSHRSVSLGVGLSAWVCASTLQACFNKGLWQSKKSMLAAHLGLALLTLGVTVTSHYSIERELLMRPGQTVRLNHYDLTLLAVKPQDGPNYLGHKAYIKLAQDGRTITTLHPEKRFFLVQEQTMTETDIYPHWLSDVYVALGEHSGGEQWSMRLHYKPMVRFIWAGGLIMSISAVLGLWSSRRSLTKPILAPVTTSHSSPTWPRTV